MSNPILYHVVSHLDAPKRYFTLTVDELVVAVLSLMLLVTSNHKLVVGVLGFFLYGCLKYLKQGRGPRFLLVLAYWYMPASTTNLVLPNLPASHLRVWIS